MIRYIASLFMLVLGSASVCVASDYNHQSDADYAGRQAQAAQQREYRAYDSDEALRARRDHDHWRAQEDEANQRARQHREQKRFNNMYNPGRGF